jgi:hypothetical protein
MTGTFAGTPAVSGARFYSFSSSVYGTVNATPVSIGGSGVAPDGRGRPRDWDATRLDLQQHPDARSKSVGTRV